MHAGVRDSPFLSRLVVMFGLILPSAVRADEGILVVSSSAEADAHRLTPPQTFRSEHVHNAIEVVLLQLVVDEGGHVVSAFPYFGAQSDDDRAVAIAKGWSFRPFLVNGTPTKAQLLMDVQFLPPEDLPKTHVPFPEVDNLGALEFILHRSPCLFNCPAYTVQIRGGGEVIFQGQGGPVVLGKHVSQASPQAIAALIQKARDADFFSLRDTYRSTATDQATVEITIAVGTIVKTVSDYAGTFVGMPSTVRELELAIDNTARTNQWMIQGAQSHAQ